MTPNPLAAIEARLAKATPGPWRWSRDPLVGVQKSVTYIGKPGYPMFNCIHTDEPIRDRLDSRMVLHHCDNPSCFNPTHLYVGKAEDNMRDAFERGQLTNRGERNNHAKLSEHEVREMRSLRKSGVLRKELAKRYGVHEETVYNICAGNRWAYVT